MPSFTHSEYDSRGKRHVYDSPTFDGLVKIVVKERQARGKSADYGKVYNELSRRYGAGNSRSAKAEAQPAGPRLTWEQTVNGAKVVLKNVAGKVVSQAEINRRGTICSAGNGGAPCPKLQHVSGCKRCGLAKEALALFKATQSLFGKNTYDIPTHLKKTYCGVCGCAHSAILPARQEDFLPDTPEKAKERPAYCWVKPSSPDA